MSEDHAMVVSAHPGAGALTFCGRQLPTLIAEAGEGATRRFVDFFTAHIRNPNTRQAYAQAVSQFLSTPTGRPQALVRRRKLPFFAPLVAPPASLIPQA